MFAKAGKALSRLLQLFDGRFEIAQLTKKLAHVI